MLFRSSAAIARIHTVFLMLFCVLINDVSSHSVFHWAFGFIIAYFHHIAIITEKIPVKIFPSGFAVQQNHENVCPRSKDSRKGKFSGAFRSSFTERQKAAILKAKPGDAAKSGVSFCEEFTLQSQGKRRRIVVISGTKVLL